jgi:carbonic anhydrase/acetyltransferase-like protein (isoleucine patch superfamily)
VAGNATVVGRVRLDAGVTVWFGAVIRGDTEDIAVGPRTNIQDNAVLHADPGLPLDIGADCTIGHGAIVHGCTIGEGSLIGMGAIVLNGARIGRNCIVGAHALVTEGKEFAEGSLIVGSPARAVRQLDAETIAKTYKTAAHYVAAGQRYLQGLRALDGD